MPIPKIVTVDPESELPGTEQIKGVRLVIVAASVSTVDVAIAVAVSP